MKYCLETTKGFDKNSKRLDSYTQHKYNVENGKVILRWKSTSNKIILEVEDTETAIPPALQRRVFERFYRLDKSRSHVEGMGFGLSIVKHGVAYLGGEGSLTSTEGKGTLVRIILQKKSQNSSFFIGI